ncbi:MAG: hypothetical protein KAQ94_08525 [Arcobacteraceae bacterium]|nr:hypothetical protein [Arcobacteraceae bacterium]
MKKYLIVLILLSGMLEASIEVIKASKNIKFKDKIIKSDIYIDNVDFNKVKRFCKPITKEDLSTNEYRAKIHIKRDNIICKKDLYKLKKINKVLFNFGSIQIERSGKIIRETKEYIRLRDDNGEIQKIYKDGRVR